MDKRVIWKTYHSLSERPLVIAWIDLREQTVDPLNIQLRLSERRPYDAYLYVTVFKRIPDEQDSDKVRLACLASPSHNDREIRLNEGCGKFSLIAKRFHLEEVLRELNGVVGNRRRLKLLRCRNLSEVSDIFADAQFSSAIFSSFTMISSKRTSFRAPNMTRPRRAM